jgi:hypothetical protein
LWMFGTRCPNPRTMFRDCIRMNLPDPRTSTYGTICAQIMVTEQEIKNLSKDAPALRCQHLLELIENAEKNDDSLQAKAIVEILCQDS